LSLPIQIDGDVDDVDEEAAVAAASSPAALLAVLHQLRAVIESASVRPVSDAKLMTTTTSGDDLATLTMLDSKLARLEKHILATRDKDEFQCPVCLEECSRGISTSKGQLRCENGHSLCGDCSETLFDSVFDKEKLICPCCRSRYHARAVAVAVDDARFNTFMGGMQCPQQCDLRDPPSRGAARPSGRRFSASETTTVHRALATPLINILERRYIRNNQSSPLSLLHFAPYHR
jgi:hypothetical protein